MRKKIRLALYYYKNASLHYLSYCAICFCSVDTERVKMLHFMECIIQLSADCNPIVLITIIQGSFPFLYNHPHLIETLAFGNHEFHSVFLISGGFYFIIFTFLLICTFCVPVLPIQQQVVYLILLLYMFYLHIWNNNPISSLCVAYTCFTVYTFICKLVVF